MRSSCNTSRYLLLPSTSSRAAFPHPRNLYTMTCHALVIPKRRACDVPLFSLICAACRRRPYTQRKRNCTSRFGRPEGLTPSLRLSASVRGLTKRSLPAYKTSLCLPCLSPSAFHSTLTHKQTQDNRIWPLSPRKIGKALNTTPRKSRSTGRTSRLLGLANPAPRARSTSRVSSTVRLTIRLADLPCSQP